MKIATVCSGIGSPDNYIIYKADFKNGKSYIGLTRTSLNQRKSEHLYRSKQKMNIPFYNAIKKYGWENVKWSVIDNCSTLEEAEQSEINYISHYKNNYNATKGGNAGVISDESRLKISKALKGRVFTDEWKAKISVSVKAIFSDEKERKLLSERTKKAMWSPQVRANYLKAIERRNNLNSQIALQKMHIENRKSKFLKLKKTYKPGMTWEKLHKTTGVSLVFIRKYRMLWMS